MQQFKIVVAGPQGSGKTEMILRLAELYGGKEPLRMESQGSTVCMDYTYCDVDGSRFNIFGTPGSDHLSVIRKSLSKGMNALILVVPNDNPESFLKARKIFEELVEDKEVPTIVAVNKKHFENTSFSIELKDVLKVSDKKVVTIDAKSGEGIDTLFSEMVKTVRGNPL